MKGLIIFDLDGTLLRSHEHICPAARETQAALGLPVRSDAEIYAAIGETSMRFFQKLAPGCADKDRFIALFRTKERAALEERGRLYEGIMEMLTALRSEGYRLAICSNASMEYIQLALKTTNSRSLFHTVMSARNDKSKTSAVAQLIQGATCDTVMMVGDASHDHIAALENRIPMIAADYGYGGLEGADGICFHATAPGNILPLIRQVSVYAQIAARVRQAPGVRCIGVNGVDTSGKSIFAGRFAAYLKETGTDAVVVHLDDFHNLKALRQQGKNEIDAYIQNAFDLDTLANELLIPLHRHGEVRKTLSLLDLERDSYTLKRRYDIGKNTLVILEGVLLYRKPLAKLIDYKIYLDIGFDEVLRRAAARDVPRYGSEFLERYKRKYIPVQQLYIDTYKPKEISDILIDNTDPGDPCVDFLV